MPLRDTLEITVQGGKGGDGGMSFLRLKYMPKGGPDGGHGGHGGGVWLETVEDVASLERLVSRRHYKGETGAQGEGRNKAGKQGVDLTLQVPAGTLVLDADTGERLADLLNVGERALGAPGGVGGRDRRDRADIPVEGALPAFDGGHQHEAEADQQRPRPPFAHVHELPEGGLVRVLPGPQPGPPRSRPPTGRAR